MSIIVADYSGHKVDIKKIRRVAGSMLKKLKKKWSVGIFFVPEKKIRSLNREYRHKDKSTDVLSFEMKEDGYLGDVIISPAVAERNSRRYGAVCREEMMRLVVHGILHLLGHDHVLADERKIMFKLQDKLLKEV